LFTKPLVAAPNKGFILIFFQVELAEWIYNKEIKAKGLSLANLDKTIF
jgi:hypothetical protein